jgi:hypothetical protein
MVVGPVNLAAEDGARLRDFARSRGLKIIPALRQLIREAK